MARAEPVRSASSCRDVANRMAGRPSVRIHQPGTADALHAGVRVRQVQRQAMVTGLHPRSGRGQRVLEDLSLDGLALEVLLIQQPRPAAGLRHIVGHEKIQRRHGVVQARPAVNSGGDLKRDRLSVHNGFSEVRPHRLPARLLPEFDHAQAVCDDRAVVDAGDGHAVRHGAAGDVVEHAPQRPAIFRVPRRCPTSSRMRRVAASSSQATMPPAIALSG